MSAKDEKSKLKKTQALSPEEADKARARLRAAMANAPAAAAPAPAPAAPRPEVSPPRAGAPLSPFEAGAPKTQVLGADEARKALEQVERARAGTTPVAKTVVMSKEQAKDARALIASKTGDSPSKLARRSPKTADGPSKLRRESAPKRASKPPAAPPAMTKTLPIASPRRSQGTEPPPTRAGAPISPFGAATKTQVLGADETRKALEQVAQARALAAGAQAKAGDSPSKLGRKAPRADSPSKLRREPPSKMGRRPAGVSPALMKTVPLAGRPRRATEPAPAAKPASKPKVAPPATPSPAKPSPTTAPPAVALMHGAKLRGARLVRADLRGADLRGADLAEADLAHADLSLARLDDADLSFANLYKTKLDGAEMRGCDRSGTRKINPDRG